MSCRMVYGNGMVFGKNMVYCKDMVFGTSIMYSKDMVHGVEWYMVRAWYLVPASCIAMTWYMV